MLLRPARTLPNQRISVFPWELSWSDPTIDRYPDHSNRMERASYADLSEAMSIEKRYFTSALSIRS
jgi:hypothetical protein